MLIITVPRPSPCKYFFIGYVAVESAGNPLKEVPKHKHKSHFCFHYSIYSIRSSLSSSFIKTVGLEGSNQAP